MNKLDYFSALILLKSPGLTISLLIILILRFIGENTDTVDASYLQAPGLSKSVLLPILLLPVQFCIYFEIIFKRFVYLFLYVLPILF